MCAPVSTPSGARAGVSPTTATDTVGARASATPPVDVPAANRLSAGSVGATGQTSDSTMMRRTGIDLESPHAVFVSTSTTACLFGNVIGSFAFYVQEYIVQGYITFQQLRGDAPTGSIARMGRMSAPRQGDGMVSASLAARGGTMWCPQNIVSPRQRGPWIAHTS